MSMEHPLHPTVAYFTYKSFAKLLMLENNMSGIPNGNCKIKIKSAKHETLLYKTCFLTWKVAEQQKVQ